MSEVIRQDTEYAMRALVYLAWKSAQKCVTAKELASYRDLPEDFTYKILRKLTHSGLTTRQMGPQGGFKLARSPGEITFLQVITAIQGPIMIKKCCVELEACPKQSNCEISPQLMELQDRLLKSLDSITLADVLKEESKTRGEGTGK